MRLPELTVKVTVEPDNVAEQVSVYRDLVDRPVIAVAHPYVDANAVGEAVLALLRPATSDASERRS